MRVTAIICEDIGGSHHRCIPIGPRTPECDPRCTEHQQPAGYVAASEWAEFMLETHDQQQCPGCGLWTIWVERPPHADREPAEEQT